MNEKPRQILCGLIRQHGAALSQDRNRCSGLLRDLCAGFKAETAVLLTAMEEGIPASLTSQSGSIAPEILIGRLVKRMQEDRQLTEEAARWAVESWALALGIGYSAGATANAISHSTPQPSATSQRNTVYCPQCGNANSISAKFCANCSAGLLYMGQVVPEAPSRTTTSDNSEEFYKAAIGPKNQSYYLRHFQRFDRDGKTSAAWHWPAFFVFFYWLLYRKMWRNALIYFILPYAIMIPLGIISAMIGDSDDVALGFGYIFYMAGIFLLPPLYANAWYYKHCKNKVAQAKATSHDVQRQLGELSAKGGTSNGVLIVILVLVFVCIIGILAAIAIPAYQDYTTRVRISTAIFALDAAKISVAEYYVEHETLPTSLEEAGFTELPPASVGEVDFDNKKGIISMTMSNEPIAGKTLLMVPSLDENKQIVWQCMSQEIANKYLPSQCRQ